MLNPHFELPNDFQQEIMCMKSLTHLVSNQIAVVTVVFVIESPIPLISKMVEQKSKIEDI